MDGLTKTKILFIIPSLYTGGAERFVINFLKFFNRDKLDLTLVLLSKEGELVSEIPNDIRIIELKCHAVRDSFFKISKLIRKEKPEVVFSTLGHLNLMLSVIKQFIFLKCKFIVREASTLSEFTKESRSPFIMDLIAKKFYPKLDAIICQSESMKSNLVRVYKVKPSKTEVIYNPVDLERIVILADKTPEASVPLNGPFCIAIGRLGPEKGYLRMIESFAKIKSDNLVLFILGKGEMHTEIQTKISELKIDNRVKLIGFQSNPYFFLKRAKFLLVASYHEGLSNVVIEALSLGKPVIAFDCNGVTELITQNKNGIIIQNDNQIKYAEAIDKLNLELFSENEIIKSAEKLFLMSDIMVRYEKVLISKS